MGLTREQLFRKLGIIRDGPDLDKYTEKAYADLEREIWESNLEDSPHGHLWHTSFHASSFPGTDKSCGRAALYTLMDIPNVSPSSPRLRAIGEIGKAVEYQIVYKWARAGLTIGGAYPTYDGGPITQIGFEDEETWLTGSSDAILDLRPDWEYALPVDVKSKAHDVIEKMKVGLRSWDDKHYGQIQGYIYLANKFHEDMGWDRLGLKPANAGILYYASRQDPRFTHTFFIEADWEFINAGVERLKSYKEAYLRDELLARPKEWKWTEEPCKYCPFKKEVCKPDYKAKTQNLTASAGIPFAKSVRSSYNPAQKNEEVMKRWTK